ncbi:mycothiol synthase [Micromonospora sp. HM5-17]|uniref:mycothiol synthase n=1 Tax=Micromonospora sp. HM5-17 TaxID=2487710 RepID=UPI000F49715D|nr:mycothiol synthase [Micromonospora sp. HM5-17]ROT31886.1 mycothiol synthase [Micromonospora sp. HM5-17]
MISETPAEQRISRLDVLGPDEVAAVHELVAAAGAADGADPLDEHVTLRLRHPVAGATHLLARQPDGSPVGYAYLEPAPTPGEFSAGLVVHPGYRRRGLGRALVEVVRATAGDGRLLVWAHGDHPSAAALALDLGFARARVLWQLRRSLRGPLPEPHLPDGVSLRAFRPGADDAAWLRVNRRAFANHPEQGRWDETDLRLRLAEPWFDPAGFLLAVESATGRVLGFHWTKVHRRDGGGEAGPVEPVGEVYVLGVDPDAHGRGLGRALTLAGLHHLRAAGLTRVMLYVDESNNGAVALYTRLGFDTWVRHVQYRWPATTAD